MKARELIEIIATQIQDNWEPKNKWGSLWIERKVNEGKEFVVFNTTKTHGGFILNGVLGCEKSFSEVEEILTPLYKKYELGYMNKSIQFSSSRDDQHSKLNIVSFEELKQVLPWILGKVKNEIYPFFDKYKTLTQVHDKINSLDKSEISHFVYAPPVIKVLTIKGVLKASDFEEYADWAIGIYEEMSIGKENQFEGKSLSVLKELKNIFT